MYNQKYHKFNTFYNHKFGFHITGPRQDAFEAVFRLKPKVVKTLDFSVDIMKRIKQEIPDVFLIGRLFVHPQDFGQLSGGTAQVARQKGAEMAERILREEVNQDRNHINGQPIFNAWESLNEVFPEWTDENTQKLYDEYQVAFGEKMLAAGFEPIAFNFGQGNGRGEQWLRLFPGTLETYKYLGFHEYDWPTMDRLHNIGLNGPSEPHNLVPVVGEGRGNDGMWRCLRYRRVMYEGIRQKYGDKHSLIITECGMTQGVWGGPSHDIGPWAKELTVPRDIPGGVVDTPIPVDDYWNTLQWYNSEIMKDDYVMGACLFVTGAAGKAEWETFEHLGPIMARIANFQREAPIEANPAPASSLSSPGGSTSAPQARARARVVEEAKKETTPERAANQPQPRTRPTTQPITEPAPQPASAWSYKLAQGAGLPLLVGDIGLANERITITKPDGQVDQPTSGSKPEHGKGGFETYANQPGTYRIEFMGERFEITLSGQFTRIVFERKAAAPASPPPAQRQGPSQATPSEKVAVQFTLRDDRPNYAVGERIFFRIAVANQTNQPVSFGIMGLLTNTGHFQTSWDNGVIRPGQTFRHEDGLSFSSAGNYQVQLSICYSTKPNCMGPDGDWVRYEPKVGVTVG